MAALAQGLTQGIQAGLSMQSQVNENKRTKLAEDQFEKEKKDNELIIEVLKNDDATEQLLSGKGGTKGFKLGQQMQASDIAKKRLEIATEQLGLDKKRAGALKNSPDGQKFALMNTAQQDDALANNEKIQVMLDASPEAILSAKRRSAARLRTKQRSIRINTTTQPNDNDRESVATIMKTFTLKDGTTSRAIFDTDDVDFDTDLIQNDVAGLSKGIVAGKSSQGIKSDPVSTGKAILNYLRPVYEKKGSDTFAGFSVGDKNFIIGADYQVNVEEYDRRIELLGRSPQEIANLAKTGVISREEAVQVLDVIGTY